MRELHTIFLILVLMAFTFHAGCLQSQGNSSVTPVGLAANVSPQEPAKPATAAAVTSVPVEIVTIFRYVSPPRDVKDSRLLFTLQVPAEWNVSTYRMLNSDTSDYRTDLVGDDVFTIYTYIISGSREQEFRDRFRQWSPAPVETRVTINEIRYDRYESRIDDNVTVAYLSRSTSANERGYGSVLVFTARESNRFEREDFEKVVSSFRYFSGRSASTQPGEEIPVYNMKGNLVSRDVSLMIFNTSDWDAAGGDLSDAGSSGGSSSGGSSPGGGGCGG